jgi:thiol-disulfide isomerase/thioredoxin
MHPFAARIALVTTLSLAVAACTGGAPTPAETAVGGGDTATDPAWRSTELTDVRSGETFTIDGLKGKLVAIEPMAIWCSNCRIQQREAMTALAAVASDDLVYIGVDVDPNEQVDALAAYAEEQGFDWMFAVASKDVARSLAAEFGDQVLSPPSTPLILLGPGGTVIETHFGIRGAAELEALFRQHLP